MQSSSRSPSRRKAGLDFLRKHFPEEWEDDAARSVLMNPLPPQRQVDSESWDNKMKFWSDVVEQYAEETCSMRTTVGDLEASFDKPPCMMQVCQQMLESGGLVRADDLLDISDAGIMKTIKIVSSAIGQSVFGWNTLDSETELGITVTLDQWSHRVLSVLQKMQIPGHPLLLTELKILEGLQEEASQDQLKADQLRLVLGYMNGKKIKVQLLKSSGIWAVKYDKGDKSPTVTAEDAAVLSLLSARDKLAAQFRTLEERRQKHRRTALEKYKGKQTMIAKTELMACKRIEKREQRILEQQGKIDEMIFAIQDATRMQDILKVLADGSAALNGLHASQSMSSETIDTLLDSISESIDHQQDIDQALSDCSSIQGTDTDLEQELDELLDEVQQEHGRREEDEKRETLLAQLSELEVHDTTPMRSHPPKNFKEQLSY